MLNALVQICLFIFGQPKTNQKAALYKLLVSSAVIPKRAQNKKSILLHPFFGISTTAQLGQREVRAEKSLQPILYLVVQS